MNARKLPSGRWQSIVYTGKIDGKKKYVTITEDTRKDCLLRAAAVLEEANKKKTSGDHITVEQAVDRYIESKRGTLSPATIRGYVKIQKNHIENSPIASCQVSEVTDETVQLWISAFHASKKTIMNAYGLLRPAIKMFRKDASFAVEFPKGKRYKGYVPSTDEVIAFLSAAKETRPDLYRACLFAAFSTLRRSEITCLTADDISGNILHIDKSMVKDEHGSWVIKDIPKEEESVRDIPLPQWVIAEMPKQGRLVSQNPDWITNEFGRLLDKLSISRFRFHDLRKFSVSLMHHKGVSMSSIAKLGGWSNINTPTQIYIKSIEDEKEREMKSYLNFAEGMATKL